MRFFTPQNNKVLDSLGLYSGEIQTLMEKLVKQNTWTRYLPDAENSVGVQFIKLEGKRYFALVDCESLCGIKDKAAFIQTAVEFAIKEHNLKLKYKDLAVGGLAGDEGRKAFFYKLSWQTPPADHAYAVFKMPGEEQAYIEDPRTGIFNLQEKLQSRTDNQVCCFAASALFYFCYQLVKKGTDSRKTPELFAELYQSNKLRTLIQSLENKVGKSTASKAQIINSFAKQLGQFKNPLDKVETSELISTSKPSYADVVRNNLSPAMP